MARTGSSTRELIIQAAEKLFAEHGIEGVSLREINRTAGQLNTGAVQYHFGDRDGLVRAILDKHAADLEPRRHALLDQYEAAGMDDMRAMAAAYVFPLASKLEDPDGGREFLRIASEYFTRPATLDELIPVKDHLGSLRRWHEIMDELLPAEQDTWLSFRFPALRFTHVELARRAAGPPRPDNRLFTSHLVDLVTALLTTEPSVQTARILGERIVEDTRPDG
jgi:AcrR family transcriptional regulator